MNMNNGLVVIENCHICQVRFLPRVVGKPLPGEVVCGGDTAYFEFASGHDVVTNDDGEPCFGPGKASFLQVGDGKFRKSDEIVAQVEEVRRGHYVVTAWTHIRDWQAALEELAKPRSAKPAPALPVPVMEIATSVKVNPKVQVEVDGQPKNQTGLDRRTKRPIFKPTTRSTETAPMSAVSPDEARCLAAAAKLESLPPAEATAECSTAPAVTVTKTAEPVAKQ